MSEENTRLWNTGLDSDKEIARKRKRKLSYYSNILVVSDPKHPENEGKTFYMVFELLDMDLYRMMQMRKLNDDPFSHEEIRHIIC